MKKYMAPILKFAVATTIVNVWLFRSGKQTIYRGGEATDLVSEFAVYGLSENTMYAIGTLKVLAALLMLISIFYKKMELPPLFIIGGLMTAALYFHFSIGDALIKSLPAALLLSGCTAIYFLRFQKQTQAQE
jgi:hypothetical protein